MNAMWKPQTKKPLVSSRKLGCANARRSAARADSAGSPADASSPAPRPLRATARSGTSATKPPSRSSAVAGP